MLTARGDGYSTFHRRKEEKTITQIIRMISGPFELALLSSFVSLDSIRW